MQSKSSLKSQPRNGSTRPSLRSGLAHHKPIMDELSFEYSEGRFILWARRDILSEALVHIFAESKDLIMWYVYILECENGQLYTGITNNAMQRFQQHKDGKGGIFTRTRKAIKICYTQELQTKRQAAIREKQIKRWTRKKKLALINRNFELLKKL